MKEEKLEYRKELIDVIDSLAPVNHRILITKVDDKVMIKGNDESKNFLYVITAPLSYFNFPEGVDSLGLIDFTRFKKFFVAMSTKTSSPDLYIQPDQDNVPYYAIFKSSERSDSLTLRLGDPQLPTFAPGFRVLSPYEANVSMDLTRDVVDEIKKKISLIGSDYTNVIANDNVLNFSIYTMRSADKADAPYFLQNPATRSFTTKYKSDAIMNIPDGDYTAEFDGDGCIDLKQKREDEISLEIMLLAED